MEAHLVKTLYAEAAHRNVHGGAAQRRLHGHSYKIEICGSGMPDADIGWIVDLSEMKLALQPVYSQIDHAYLNELPGLEKDSTMPALERWIMSHIVPRPPWLDRVRVSIVGDLCFEPVIQRADDFSHLPERIRFTFEAAQSLPQLPSAHPCCAVHGHSYRIEVGAEDLDALEPHLRGIYDLLDHQYLNEIAGLERATIERMAEWMWRRLSDAGNELTIVSIQETNSARCLYYGE